MGGKEEIKRGRRERKAQGFRRREREKPTESKMKERDVRVGGNQGKTGEEREETRENWRREGGC